jgi:hypothetical protein
MVSDLLWPSQWLFGRRHPRRSRAVRRALPRVETVALIVRSFRLTVPRGGFSGRLPRLPGCCLRWFLRWSRRKGFTGRSTRRNTRRSTRRASHKTRRSTGRPRETLAGCTRRCPRVARGCGTGTVTWRRCETGSRRQRRGGRQSMPRRARPGVRGRRDAAAVPGRWAMSSGDWRGGPAHSVLRRFAEHRRRRLRGTAGPRRNRRLTLRGQPAGLPRARYARRYLRSSPRGRAAGPPGVLRAHRHIHLGMASLPAVRRDRLRDSRLALVRITRGVTFRLTAGSLRP